MSSIRHVALKALADSGILTLDELQEKLGEKERKRVLDNVNAAIKEDLISRHKDDATHMPAYQITAAGRKRLAEGVMSKGGENAKKKTVLVEAEKPARVDAIPGDVGLIGMDATVQESEPNLDDVDLSRWPEVAASYGIATPGQLSEILDGLSSPAQRAPDAAPRGFMCLPAIPDIETLYPTEADARAAAQKVALSEQDSFHVMALLDTAKFRFVPSIEWGE